MRSFGTTCLYSVTRQVADQPHDVVPLIFARQQLAAHAVDGFALLVHHVIVFEEMFAGPEVLGLDGLLSSFDALGDQLRLDRHVFFHAELQHQVLDLLAPEDPQEIIL